MSSNNSSVKTKLCAFCGCKKANLRLCGACRNVYYCCSEHQKEHWKIHKLSCHKSTHHIKKSNDKQTKLEKTDSPDEQNYSKTKKQYKFHLDDTPNDDTCAELDSLKLINATATSASTSKSCNGKSKLDITTTISSSSDHPLNLSKKLIEPMSQAGANEISSLSDADLSTPFDPQMSTVQDDVSGSLTTKLSGQSLCELDLTPNLAHSAELDEDYLTNVISYVLRDLNKYGFCAVDNFLGEEKADRVLADVKALHSSGKLSSGRVVSSQVQRDIMSRIRGDKITWVSGSEPGCGAIGLLTSIVDAVVKGANVHEDAGKLANYVIGYRTKAMVACYPGGGSHYVKHIDNPNQDGRCITAIYYVNKNWTINDGGVLRIYPTDLDDTVAQIEPLFDRMLFFWSDRRNPHEVLPSTSVRYAITVWYLDVNERRNHQEKIKKT